MIYSSATLLIINENPINIPLLEPQLTNNFEVPSWACSKYRTCEKINLMSCNRQSVCMMLLHLRPVIEAFNSYRSIDTGRVILHGKNIETSITDNASNLFFTLFWQLALHSSCTIFKKHFAVLGRQYSYSMDLDVIFYKFYSAHITRTALTLNEDISIGRVKKKMRESFQELKCFTTSLLDIVRYWELKDVTKNALVFIINALTLMLDDFEDIEQDYRLKLENNLSTQ